MPKTLSSVLDANDCLMCPSRESQSEKKATGASEEEQKESEKMGKEKRDKECSKPSADALRSIEA